MSTSLENSEEKCVNLEDMLLIWVNICLEEFNYAQQQLRSSINYQILVDNLASLERYISQNLTKDDRAALVISSESISEDFLSWIHAFRSLSSIYIRCVASGKEKESDLKKWSTCFFKIRGTFSTIDELITKIKYDQHRHNQDSQALLGFSSFNISNSTDSERSCSDLNAQFLHSLLIFDVLLRMKTTSNDSNQELINICTNAYQGNVIELDNIQQFALSYTSDQAISWYTKNCFLFKVLNKALRIENIHMMYLFRSFICDLYVQLKQYKCTAPINVYRGQLMVCDEFDELRCSVGRYISMNSFLSTTLKRDLAIFYLGASRNFTTDLKRVIFEIYADPTVEGIKPFAKIDLYSEFPNEEEVLFMPRNIFRIVKINSDSDNGVEIIRMVLCGEKENHLKAIYEQNRKNYGGGRQKETNLMTLGNVLQRMGQCDKAEMFYLRQLNELLNASHQDEQMISTCYFNMGETFREKGDCEIAIVWYQKSLDIDTRRLPSGHPNIGNIYNSIGIVQEEKGDYESALDSYSIALKSALEAFGWNNTRVALCLNNTGNAYQAMGNYIEALDCHRIAFIIRRKNLPPDHHRLAASHNNIGVVYHRLGHFDLALERYKTALDIDRRSLPPYHSDIGKILRNIGLLHEQEGKFRQALEYFEKEAIRRRLLKKSNHLDVSDVEEDIKRLNSKILK